MGRIVFVLCRIVLVSLRLILRIKGYVSVAWGLFCAVFVVVVVGCWLEIGVRVVGVRMRSRGLLHLSLTFSFLCVP
jgi:hypothetical protein